MLAPHVKTYEQVDPLSLQKRQMTLLQGISRNDSVIGSYSALAKPPFVLLPLSTLDRHFSGFSSTSYLPQENGKYLGRCQGRANNAFFAFPPTIAHQM